MTKQEAYKQIREWFMRPDAVFGAEDLSKEEYTVRGLRCVYRANGDKNSQVRCSIGCLIPDELYDSTWDANGGKAFSDLVGAYGFEGVLGTSLDEDDLLEFLAEVQQKHDDTSGHDHPSLYFIRDLDELAREWALEVPA